MATINNSWSLIAFAKSFGPKIQLAEFSNKESGEVFKSLVLTDSNDNRTFVGFSSKMGELTPSQLKAQKHELQVVQLESGNFKLCRQGENTWQDVDLGI